MKIKELYKFTVPKNVTETLKEETIAEDGAKTTVEKPVKTSKDIEFCIRKPSARFINDAQLFYNVQVGNGLTEGLISAALLHKRLKNDGGSLPDADKEVYGDKILEYFQADEEYKKIIATEESLRTPEQIERIPILVKKLKVIEKDLQDIQVREENIYNITAESWARSKTILWWFLCLLCEKNKDKEWAQMFDGATFKEKERQFYEVQDGSDDMPDDEIEFIGKVIAEGQKAVIAWYYYREDETDKDLTWQEKISKALGRINKAVDTDKLENITEETK